MNDERLREILAEELDKAGAKRSAEAVRDNDWAGATGITASLAAMRRVYQMGMDSQLDAITKPEA